MKLAFFRSTLSNNKWLAGLIVISPPFSSFRSDKKNIGFKWLLL
jgi:hypothetical protein